jgi:CDP-diacylglycerol--glycerol-3-phosphate 3-phosphatidyltransferase
MVCGIIPLWLFLIFLYRDMLMALLRIVCASKGTVLAARNSGKAKAVFQGTSIGLVVIICLLQAYHAPFVGARWLGLHPGFWLVAFSATITVLSVFDYLIPNWPKVVAMSTPAGSRRGGS